MTKEEIYEENMRNEYLRTFLTGERQGPILIGLVWIGMASILW